MIKLKFKDCCMECGYVDLDYDYMQGVDGEKSVCVYCNHMNVCERYKKAVASLDIHKDEIPIQP